MLDETAPVDVWYCLCGFRNSSGNDVCGGAGPLGCKAPRATASVVPVDVWYCLCGFRNSSGNDVCGGAGPLGCKASRATASVDPRQLDEFRTDDWMCTCGFMNSPLNVRCGGTGPKGCKADRRFAASPVPMEDWVCKCGFKNSRRNGICGGIGVKGCKAERPSIIASTTRCSSAPFQPASDDAMVLRWRQQASDLCSVKSMRDAQPSVAKSTPKRKDRNASRPPSSEGAQPNKYQKRPFKSSCRRSSDCHSPSSELSSSSESVNPYCSRLCKPSSNPRRSNVLVVPSAAVMQKQRSSGVEETEVASIPVSKVTRKKFVGVIGSNMERGGFGLAASPCAEMGGKVTIQQWANYGEGIASQKSRPNDRRRAEFEEWLLNLDSRRGSLLQYLESLVCEFEDLQKLAATANPFYTGSSVVQAVDPAVFEVLGVRSLGHKLLLAKGIRALGGETD